MKPASGYLRCWPRHPQKWSLLSRLKQSCADDLLSSQRTVPSLVVVARQPTLSPRASWRMVIFTQGGAFRLCFLTFWFYCRIYFVSYLFFQKLHPSHFQFPCILLQLLFLYDKPFLVQKRAFASLLAPGIPVVRLGGFYLCSLITLLDGVSFADIFFKTWSSVAAYSCLRLRYWKEEALSLVLTLHTTVSVNNSTLVKPTQPLLAMPCVTRPQASPYPFSMTAMAF